MFLDIPPILIEEEGNHYDLNTYKDLTSEEVYAVGDDDEVSEAMEQYFDGYVDNVGGIDNIDRYTVDDFIELDDYSVQQYAEETADYRLDEMDEDDVISDAGYDSRESYEDRMAILEERIDELNSLIEEKQDELDERLDDDEDFFGTEEYEELKEEIDDLEIELSDKQTTYEGLGDELRELFDTARSELHDTMVSDIISEIENDGVDYFIDNLGLSFKEAVDYYCTFDEAGLERYLAENEDRGNTLSGYDGSENEQFYNGETYYIYRTD
jgi:predicted RNase H-like nuclease (RuvC/YqgF family)